MQIDTAWVSPPNEIRGRDHLGTQAPCINVYGQLIPGITNVTDRARYYSFYPWLVSALESEGYVYGEEFIDRFRKADCLFTLISLRHADVSTDDYDRHAGASVGSTNLGHALSKIKESGSINLSTYATRAELPDRYFKSMLGGLGQYYIGTLAELELMSGSSKEGVKVIRQTGGRLARAFAQGVPGAAFINAVEKDQIDLNTLDSLSAFCHCQLVGNDVERNELIDVLLGRGAYQGIDELHDSNARQRHLTLKLIITLSEALKERNYKFDAKSFRGIIYSGAYDKESPIKWPNDMRSVVDGWASYQRNELLSVALQGLFFVCLNQYEGAKISAPDTSTLSQWFWTTPLAKKILNDFPSAESFNQMADMYVLNMPSIFDWQSEKHEVYLAAEILELCRSRERGDKRDEIIIKNSIAILSALINRNENMIGYGELTMPPQYFDYYPVNLRNYVGYVRNEWAESPVQTFLEKILKQWCLDAHLRVALRKLRQQSQSTFRFMRSDRGISVIDVPSAVYTTPRFNQSIRILADIGVLALKDEQWVPGTYASELG